MGHGGADGMASWMWKTLTELAPGTESLIAMAARCPGSLITHRNLTSRIESAVVSAHYIVQHCFIIIYVHLCLPMFIHVLSLSHDFSFFLIGIKLEECS